MKEVVLTKSINFISQYKEYSDDELEQISYGLEGLYLTVTKLVIIVLLSIILNIFKEVMIILVLFNIIRYFGFGIHAKKSSECLISSIFCFIILPYFLLSIRLNNITNLIIGIICIINFILFAPADTVKRPLKNKKKRLIRKVSTTIIGAIFIIISMIFEGNTISTLFMASVIIEVIMINPITYLILRQPYNNYKKINNEVKGV